MGNVVGRYNKGRHFSLPANENPRNRLDKGLKETQFEENTKGGKKKWSKYLRKKTLLFFC